MRSDLPITRISPPGRPAVHAYFDIPPESPDGANLVADVMNWPERGTGGILVYDLTTGGFNQIVTMATRDTSHATGCHPHPAWSRDGRRIYFNSADDGVPAVYALDLE